MCNTNGTGVPVMRIGNRRHHAENGARAQRQHVATTPISANSMSCSGTRACQNRGQRCGKTRRRCLASSATTSSPSATPTTMRMVNGALVMGLSLAMFVPTATASCLSVIGMSNCDELLAADPTLNCSILEAAHSFDCSGCTCASPTTGSAVAATTTSVLGSMTTTTTGLSEEMQQLQIALYTLLAMAVVIVIFVIATLAHRATAHRIVLPENQKHPPSREQVARERKRALHRQTRSFKKSRDKRVDGVTSAFRNFSTVTSAADSFRLQRAESLKRTQQLETGDEDEPTTDNRNATASGAGDGEGVYTVGSVNNLDLEAGGTPETKRKDPKSGPSGRSRTPPDDPKLAAKIEAKVSVRNSITPTRRVGPPQLDNRKVPPEHLGKPPRPNSAGNGRSNQEVKTPSPLPGNTARSSTPEAKNGKSTQGVQPESKHGSKEKEKKKKDKKKKDKRRHKSRSPGTVEESRLKTRFSSTDSIEGMSLSNTPTVSPDHHVNNRGTATSKAQPQPTPARHTPQRAGTNSSVPSSEDRTPPDPVNRRNSTKTAKDRTLNQVDSMTDVKNGDEPGVRRLDSSHFGDSPASSP